MWRTVVLVALLALSSGSDERLRVQAIQHRGWWEVRYPDGTVAANELHVPASRAVGVEVRQDGVGVLWFDDGHLPRIGDARVTFAQANGERAIVRSLHFREPQSSKLLIVGDAQFDAWLAHQKAGARSTNTEIFLTARCRLCHTVRGVAVAEQPVGPDLTHVASRMTIGAGTAPNRVGYLAGWIVDPERMKPGCGMPLNNLQSDQLQSLLAFLETLK